jgi:hypothetical protein
LQEVASLLTINSEEHEMGNTCIDCDLKILLDAEVQCEKILKRSIAIQTLAQLKINLKIK